MGEPEPKRQRLLFYQQLVPKYLSRPWRRSDGFSLKSLREAELRLGIKLPQSLRDLYQSMGRVDALCKAHNVIRQPDQLVLEEGYLIFMDENQDVVTWGLPEGSVDVDPIVWQRNNTPPTEWFSEKKPLTRLLAEMFEWYCEIGVLEARRSP